MVGVFMFVILLFVIGGSVMMARIIVQAHFFTDVTGGACIALIYTGVAQMLEPKRNELQTKFIQLENYT